MAWAKMATDLVRLPSMRIGWGDSEFRIFPCVGSSFHFLLLVVVLLFVMFACSPVYVIFGMCSHCCVLLFVLPNVWFNLCVFPMCSPPCVLMFASSMAPSNERKQTGTTFPP